MERDKEVKETQTRRENRRRWQTQQRRQTKKQLVGKVCLVFVPLPPSPLKRNKNLHTNEDFNNAVCKNYDCTVLNAQNYARKTAPRVSLLLSAAEKQRPRNYFLVVLVIVVSTLNDLFVSIRLCLQYPIGR